MIQISSKGYHKLLVWQRARELIILIYKYTEDFPKSEEFGLKSQIRRAVISVLLNIVEGHRRTSTKDFLHFLNIAEGSLTELEACLEICLDLKLINEETYNLLEEKRKEVDYLHKRTPRKDTIT